MYVLFHHSYQNASGEPSALSLSVYLKLHPAFLSEVSALQLLPEEIAAELDMPVDRVREILKISQEPVSLETPIGEEEDSHLGDFIQIIS